MSVRPGVVKLPQAMTGLPLTQVVEEPCEWNQAFLMRRIGVGVR